MNGSTAFDPSRYLTRVNGSDYLEVKWRLVWLREQHPEATIDTELVRHSDDLALFCAKVTLPSGAEATGWGSESPHDFRDFIEKAETKSIGRALAALGFGTQFCPDFEFGAAAGKVVDAPIDIAATRGQQRAAPHMVAEAPAAYGETRATEKQLQFIKAIAREASIAAEQLEVEAREAFGGSTRGMSRQDASALIDRLQKTRRHDEALAS